MSRAPKGYRLLDIDGKEWGGKKQATDKFKMMLPGATWEFVEMGKPWSPYNEYARKTEAALTAKKDG